MARETFVNRISVLLRSGCKLIVVASAEEARALKLLYEATQRTVSGSTKWRVRAWNIAEGWADSRGSRRPEEAIADISSDNTQNCTMYILKDIQPLLKSDPVFTRRMRCLLKDIAHHKKCVVLLQVSAAIPPELSDDAQVETLPLPGEDEFGDMFFKPDDNCEVMEDVVQAAKGLSLSRAQRAYRIAQINAAAGDAGIAALIQNEKKQLLAGHDALTYFTPVETAEDIGGLQNLKAWIRKRRLAYTPEARRLGIPVPKGVLLCGISGSGKSLSAKACANELGFPLLKLEAGRLFGCLVGESERITSETLSVASALAPAVLWIDELDKSFGGTTGAQGDSGTAQRVLSIILSWMQERTSELFIFATANDISALPPELCRRGRFTETFFCDIPNYEERLETLRIHCKKYLKDNAGGLDYAKLAAFSEGFTGAEIEQAVIESMLDAFEAGRDVSTMDITNAISQTVPLSVSQREVVENLRKLVTEGRFRSANKPQEAPAGRFYER